MYCPKCGKELADNVSFCQWCGNQINSSQEKSVRPASQNTNKKKAITIGVIGVVAVVLLIIIIALVAGSNSKTDYSSPIGGTTYEPQKQDIASEPESDPEPSRPVAQQQNEQPEPEPASSQNLIKNGDFSSGTDGWGLYLENGEAVINRTSDGKLQVTITDRGNKEWDIQIYYDGFSLEEGEEYELTFDVYGDSGLAFTANVQENGGNYQAYGASVVTINNGGGSVTVPFTVGFHSNYPPRLALNVGNMDAYEAKMPSGSYTFTFDNFKLYPVNGTNGSGTPSQSKPEEPSRPDSSSQSEPAEPERPSQPDSSSQSQQPPEKPEKPERPPQQ